MNRFKTPDTKKQNKKQLDLSTQESIIHKPTVSCRICLDDLEKSQIPQICKCKNENSFIHKKCWMQWVNHSDKYQEFPHTYFYLCDVCKDKVYLDTKLQFLLKKCDQIRFCSDQACCTLMMFFVLFSALTMVGALMFMQRSLTETNELHGLFIGGFVFAGLILLLDLLVYAYYTIIDLEVVIVGIDFSRIYKHTSKSQVINFQAPQVKENSSSKIMIQVTGVTFESLASTDHER